MMAGTVMKVSIRLLVMTVCDVFGFKVINSVDLPISFQATVNKKRDYVNGGELQAVIFRVPEGPPSKKTFVRKGELILKSGAPATILIAHGYMCNMRDVSFLRWMFPEFNTFIFDFRAHGEHTTGQVCTFGHDEAYDIIAAVKF